MCKPARARPHFQQDDLYGSSHNLPFVSFARNKIMKNQNQTFFTGLVLKRKELYGPRATVRFPSNILTYFTYTLSPRGGRREGGGGDYLITFARNLNQSEHLLYPLSNMQSGQDLQFIVINHSSSSNGMLRQEVNRKTSAGSYFSFYPIKYFTFKFPRFYFWLGNKNKRTIQI